MDSLDGGCEMSVHFQREIERLRKRLLTEAAIVEDALAKAIAALLNRDTALAEAVISGDHDVDREELAVEEESLKLIALHQPVAHDLRFISSVLTMNNDLERMGDLSANIAKRARWLSNREPLGWPPELEECAEAAQSMVDQSLNALIVGDANLARQVCAEDETVDRQKRQITAALRERMKREPENVDILLKMMDVPRHLERIADLATNIAEDVIFMVEGHIVRHHNEEEELEAR
jgi:phosphate transport system protein